MWAIVVITFTVIDLFFTSFEYFVIILQNFRLPNFNKIWQEIHSAEDPWDDNWDGTPYSDKNIRETIIRRYKMLFN